MINKFKKKVAEGGRHGLGVKRAAGSQEVCSLNLGSAQFFIISLSLQNQRLFLPFRDKDKVDLKGRISVLNLVKNCKCQMLNIIMCANNK